MGIGFLEGITAYYHSIFFGPTFEIAYPSATIKAIVTRQKDKGRILNGISGVLKIETRDRDPNQSDLYRVIGGGKQTLLHKHAYLYYLFYLF